MARLRTTLLALPAIPAALVIAEVIRAAHRPDLPSFPNQDPSGVFGSPEAETLRIVAVGDSSLTAPGVDELDNIWIRRIARSLADSHRVELISLGVGGSKAQDVVEGQLTEAVRASPDIAVVSVGANDALRGVRPRHYRRHLEHIVTTLAETGAGIVVFGMGDLSSIPRLPPTLRRWASHRSRAFDEIALKVAIGNPMAVKVHTRGRSSRAFFEDPTLFSGDQFHAGDRGHEVFAEDADEAFAAALALRRAWLRQA